MSAGFFVDKGILNLSIIAINEGSKTIGDEGMKIICTLDTLSIRRLIMGK